MPDIIIPCRECGREHKISEYAIRQDMSCLTCGAELSKPSQAPAMGLRLATASGPAVPPPLRKGERPTLPQHVAASPGESTVPTIQTRPEVPESKESPHWLWLLVALTVGGLLVGFQYKADAWSEYLMMYEWTRTGVVSLAYLLVLLIAFQDGPGPGLLCLVIPPYSVIYAMTSVESRLLQGVFFGALVGLFAEVYFLPDHSILLAAMQEFEQVVAWGDSMLSAASGSPMRP
jgi:hypothetical protein